MKSLAWVGSSKKDLMKFPEKVREEIGYALYLAQIGETHHSAKPFKGSGSGVYEIVCDYNTNTFRSVYVVNLDNKIYVLHVFQKKSKSGIKTPKEEVEVIKKRLIYLKEMLRG